MIRLKKNLQYDVKSEASKMSALLSGKIDKHEYITGEKILPHDQSRVIEQDKFTYYPLRKSLEINSLEISHK